MQYTRNDQAFQRGTFRVRGDVIDIFPAESDDQAIRIELFDEEVERLSFFDPLTGSNLGAVPRITVYPKTNYVTPRERILDAIEKSKRSLCNAVNISSRNINCWKSSVLLNVHNLILR